MAVVEHRRLSEAEQRSRSWLTRLGRGPALCFLALFLTAALAGLALALQPAHELSDVAHYKYWSRWGTLRGVSALYSGDFPETYAIYPPVSLYGLRIVGELYRALQDPSFEREAALASGWLTAAIRLLALGFHLLVGLVLFGLLAAWAGAWRAVLGSGLYLLNPGALWDAAVWAQPDGLHGLFSVLGIWLVGRSRPLAAGAWLGLAVLTKPQAWALMPLAGLALLRASGLKGVALAALSGSVAMLLVLLPYLAQDRLRELLTLPGRISTVMPVASANAHNLWWLVTRAEKEFVFDHQLVWDWLPLTYRQAALVCVLLALAFSLSRAWRARGPWELSALAAYFGFAWFCLTVGAHENHAYMVLPFLCLTFWRSRFLAFALIVFSVGFSYNVISHDFGVYPQVVELLGPWDRRLQLGASALNLLLLASWTAWLLRPGGGPAGQPEGAASA